MKNNELKRMNLILPNYDKNKIESDIELILNNLFESNYFDSENMNFDDIEDIDDIKIFLTKFITLVIEQLKQFDVHTWHILKALILNRYECS